MSVVNHNYMQQCCKYEDKILSTINHISVTFSVDPGAGLQQTAFFAI